MQCANTNECFEQISAYFDSKKTGYFLLVNTENYDIYQEILLRLQADKSKKCVFASKCCLPNGLPDVEQVISEGSKLGEYALIGLSQALMLQGNMAIESKIDEILSHSISGYGVILLDHCEQFLLKFIRRDIRIQKRVVLVDSEASELPQIKLVKCEEMCIGFQPLPNFSHLLAYLEKLTERQRERHPYLTVVSSISSSMFRNSIYPISEIAGIYDSLTRKYSDIAGATEKSYGNDAQWSWLAEKMKPYQSFSALVCDVFGTTSNLSLHISDVLEASDKNRKWLLWLSMKVFGEGNNKYLSYVLSNSKTYDDFEEHIYLDFVDIGIKNPDFTRYFSERKRLLKQIPENLPLISKYCDKLGQHQKYEIFYLTDESDTEKYEFMRCLSIYDYSDSELSRATQSMSRALFFYMKSFIFDSLNTKLSEVDRDFRSQLTTYFRQYKIQKLTNRIYPEFLETVNKYAVSRSYNKLQPRSSIISHMDKKNMQLFFFDALGVEYLAFILAKCEEYGLVAEVSIGHCELPSITIKNKEFIQYFTSDNWCKIDDLDEIKHHSKIYNYQKCEYPLHLFEELDVIDEELRKIQSMLVQGAFEKALIVSDHGASRLAVIYGHEAVTTIALDESGEHSGRCCLADEDPQLPFAAYEDGYSVLANYDRFKGGRKANVEVHGGASLEEVLVPIIVLTKRPDNIEICFVNSTIILTPHVIPELILYSNITLDNPRLYIGGEFYDGEFIADKKHAKFSLPNIKRKGNYMADVYDGEKNMSIALEFKAQKQTREVDLF